MKIICKIPHDPLKPRTVTVNGVTGSACTDLTAKIEDALGSRIADEMTDEFYLDDQNQTQVIEEQA